MNVYAKNYHNDEHVDSFSKGGKHNLKKREPLKRDSLSTVFTCVHQPICTGEPGASSNILYKLNKLVIIMNT